MSGLLTVESHSEFKHDGLVIVVDGVVKMDLSLKSVGFLEALVSSVEPIQLTQYTTEVSKPGKVISPSILRSIPLSRPLNLQSAGGGLGGLSFL